MRDLGPDHHTLLCSLVMDAIANDYEDFAMVVHEVTGWADLKGFRFSEDEIWFALCDVLERGLAKAYWLSPTGQPAEASHVVVDQRLDYHFLLTSTGQLAARKRCGT